MKLPLLVRSWITPRAVKDGASIIAGRGVHAVEVIPAGEVVAVKGGNILLVSMRAIAAGEKRRHGRDGHQLGLVAKATT